MDGTHRFVFAPRKLASGTTAAGVKILNDTNQAFGVANEVDALGIQPTVFTLEPFASGGLVSHDRVERTERARKKQSKLQQLQAFSSIEQRWQTWCEPPFIFLEKYHFLNVPTGRLLNEDLQREPSAFHSIFKTCKPLASSIFGFLVSIRAENSLDQTSRLSLCPEDG